MATMMFWNLFEAAKDVRAGDETAWRQQTEIINSHRPDVLAITEGWDWHLEDEALFRRALRDFGFDHGVLYEAKTTCDMALMWREGTEFVDVRRQPLTAAWWHGYLRVTLRLPGQPDPTVIMVSHFNPFDPTLRRIEASYLRPALVRAKRAVLVMDANTVAPGDPEPAPSLARNLPGEDADRTPLACLAQAGLVDVGAAAGDRRPTFGYYDKPDLPPAGPVRLDQAWATPSVAISGYRVLDSTDEDPHIDTASDHRPIWFEIN